MSVIPELEPPFNSVVIENETGTYKDFHLKPGDTYPLSGVTYPVDYGYLPGYIGEDGHDLDIFVGTELRGKLGHFTVWRGDVPEEHKYYVAMQDDELSSVLEVFAPVLIKNTPMDCTLAELVMDLERFKDSKHV